MQTKLRQTLVWDRVHLAKIGTSHLVLRQYYERLIAHLDLFPLGSHHFHITSFCEDGDLLSQWRGYGQSSGGFSVGIRLTPATRLYVEDHPNDPMMPIFRKVIYVREHQNMTTDSLIADLENAVLLDCITATKELPIKIKGPDHQGILATVADTLSLYIDLILSFKFEVFSEEKEWRLIRTPLVHSVSPEVREIRGELVPIIDRVIVDSENKSSIFRLISGPFGNTDRKSAGTKALIEWQSRLNHAVGLADSISIDQSRIVLA